MGKGAPSGLFFITSYPAGLDLRGAQSPALLKTPKGCCQSNANKSPLSKMSPPRRRASGSHRLPLSQRSGAMEFEGLAVDEVAF
jgi:hypothetical protein